MKLNLDMKPLHRKTLDMEPLHNADRKNLCFCTLDMRPSSGCLDMISFSMRAASYIIGGLLMFWAALYTTVYGLGLASTLVFRDVALPGLLHLPKFTICSSAFVAYSKGGPDNAIYLFDSNGCISSEDVLEIVDIILRPWDKENPQGKDVLNILVISLSVGLVVGLLQIGFISVLLHGLTARRAGLVKIFCVYYAVVIGLGAIATIVLSFMWAIQIVSFNWILLLLHVLGLLVINSHRKELLAKEILEFVKV